MLTWKLACGDHIEIGGFLQLARARFDDLGKIAEEKGLQIHEGFQPRTQGKYVAEIVGKKQIRKNALRGVDRLFIFPDSLPDSVFEKFPKGLADARPGREELPVSLRPPHIVGDAARRFAVFSDEFIVVRAATGDRRAARTVRLP